MPTPNTNHETVESPESPLLGHPANTASEPTLVINRSNAPLSTVRGYAQIPVAEEEADQAEEHHVDIAEPSDSVPAAEENTELNEKNVRRDSATLPRYSLDANASTRPARTGGGLLPDDAAAEGFPGSLPSTPSSRRNQPAQSRDGVFSNLSAKPTANVTDACTEEEVPAYETAAADATPPYLDTTVITSDTADDEILVEGLPVGSGFVFVWNMLVSMSFQFVGFLFTYLLHTSHAGKGGSRAGLGVTLIQYGFYLRSQTAKDELSTYYGRHPSDDGESDDALSRADWLSFLFMILGWYILLRSTTEYVRARKIVAAIACQYTPRGSIV